VRQVVGEQAATVEDLTTAVRQAVDRVQAMADPADDTERRQHPRHPVFGSGNLRVAGRVHRVSLRDLSEGGLELGLPADLTLTDGQPAHVSLPGDLGGLEIDVHVVWAALTGSTRRAGVQVDRPGRELGELAQVLHARYSS
jgi:hypothetical protein